jgi:hypothetical protein
MAPPRPSRFLPACAFAAIKTQRGALAAILNGPRYWVLDSITPDIRKGAPETTDVMQAYPQIKDRTLTATDLAGLGTKSTPPAGWTYSARTLTEPLDVVSSDGVATVIQVELQNTYQRVDEG